MDKVALVDGKANLCIVCGRSRGPGELRSFKSGEDGLSRVLIHGGHRITTMARAGVFVKLILPSEESTNVS